MATAAAPMEPRPNVPSATVRLPAVKDYEQVDREIIATLRPTLGAKPRAIGRRQLAVSVVVTWLFVVTWR